MRVLLPIIGWGAVGLLGGSCAALLVVFSFEEWSWRRINRRARR